MKLTQLQKEWIADLRKYKDRQRKSFLATRDSKEITGACCLGQLLLTAERLGLHNTKWITRYDEEYLTSKGDISYIKDYSKFNLLDKAGSIKGGWEYISPGKVKHTYENLIEANDSGVSWLEIADFIEQNPDKVFVQE